MTMVEGRRFMRIPRPAATGARWLVAVLAFVAIEVAAQPVAGSLDVQWKAGAADCAATPQPPLQVHAYEPRTFILRQSPCADFEANFLYLLIGSDKALLVDTGAVAEAGRMPLASTVRDLVRKAASADLPLIVAHTHRHGDHRAGDAQFAEIPNAEVVPIESDRMRAYFGFDHWPDGEARLDIGGRIVHALPTPGHHPDHLIFYDEPTGLLLSGDFLLPGRLLIDDTAAYLESAQRIASFAEHHPITHVLGGHIELDAQGRLYAHGANHHPHERRLELGKEHVLALPGALRGFNGFHAAHDGFVLTHPIHLLLALALGALTMLGLLAWSFVAWFRRSRRKCVRAQT
jgi:glyoxylase-like metal-dependent hydrolase (beta-lactamase superfamily II)